MPLTDLMNTYADYLAAQGSRPNTIRARLTGVGLAAQHAGKDPVWLSTREITAWLADTRTAATKATYYGHVKSWFRWLKEEGIRPDDPTHKLRRPRAPRGVPRPLTIEQVHDALAYSHGHVRSYILLGYYAGLRVHEIAQIRGEDITTDGIRVIGKGGNDSVVPAHPELLAEAASYPKRGFWFPSKVTNTGHVSPMTVSRGISRTFDACEIYATPHSLRHTAGTYVLEASGGNLRTAQLFLRHATPNSTAIYTRVRDQAVGAAVAKMPSAA